jgi:hypothetical protein
VHPPRKDRTPRDADGGDVAPSLSVHGGEAAAEEERLPAAREREDVPAANRHAPSGIEAAAPAKMHHLRVARHVSDGTDRPGDEPAASAVRDGGDNSSVERRPGGDRRAPSVDRDPRAGRTAEEGEVPTEIGPVACNRDGEHRAVGEDRRGRRGRERDGAAGGRWDANDKRADQSHSRDASHSTPKPLFA